MIMTTCDHDSVLYVVKNMRERDREEIYNLRWDDNPFTILNDVMAQCKFAWVAWHDGLPAVVIGGMPVHPGVWSMFCFGTDAFPKLALGLTKFAKHSIVPTLFNNMDVHRLQCDSHEKHVTAHKWLELLGAQRECVKRGLGRDGSNYIGFVIAVDKTNKSV